MAKKTSKKKSKKTSKKKSKPRRKSFTKHKSFTDQVTGAYQTVIDTIKGTDALRNKMERPGTTETE